MTWDNVCVLCAARGRQTRLQHGHACAVCVDRIAADLRDIGRLAELAAASIVPTAGIGASSSAYGSRPPINCDAVDVALSSVPGHDAPLLVLLEEWERMIRDMRGMAPYGPASAQRAQGASGDTQVTLTGVVGFLAAQNEWAASEPDFPLEDYAAEVRACVRVLRRWDADAQSRGYAVPCPTVRDDGTDCGYRLSFGEGDDAVTCRRCGASRTPAQLIAVGMSTAEHDVWVDAEAIARHYGVHPSTLRRWAASGRIQRSHGRYLMADVEAIVVSALPI